MRKWFICKSGFSIRHNVRANCICSNGMILNLGKIGETGEFAEKSQWNLFSENHRSITSCLSGVL